MRVGETMKRTKKKDSRLKKDSRFILDKEVKEYAKGFHDGFAAGVKEVRTRGFSMPDIIESDFGIISAGMCRYQKEHSSNPKESECL